MQARIVSIDSARQTEAFRQAADVIQRGGVIAYPTDTFYGLGADAGNREAVRRIFAIKGRPSTQPILLLLADAGDVALWADRVPPGAERLMQRFWPGPLTIIFRAKPTVPPELTAGTGTIGLRVPGSGLTRDLIRTVGCALTGTSANVSGRPSPATAEEAALAVGSFVDLILAGGRTAGGSPSTIVDASTGSFRVVREGVISLSKIGL